jgi:predicted metal-binding membrane protein
LTGEPARARAWPRVPIVVLAALLTLAALAWGYVIWLANQMDLPAAMADMPGMDMRGATLVAPALVRWTAPHFLFIFTMWAVLIYAQVMRPARTAQQRLAPAAWFAAGYLIAWTLFSVLAALAQWGLESLALLTPMMASASQRFGGLVLVVAGIYQWLPIKDACLSQCRAPLAFIQRHGGFQASATGSLRLGLRHGAYCVGCCWALMAVLFVVGVMNLLWIAALMIVALLEKAAPGGRYLGRLAGVGAVAAGLWMLWA